MKKILSIVAISTCALLLLSGCGKDTDNSKVTSNVNSDSNITIPTSNETSNVNSDSNTTIPTSNEISNVNSNSNTTTQTSNTTTSNNKNLTCTMDYSSKMGNAGYKSVIANVDVSFNPNIVNKIQMQMVFELDSKYASQIDYFVSSMKTAMQQQYTNMKGVSVTSSKLSNTKFDVKIALDVNKMSAEDLKKTEFSNVKANGYDAVKASLTSSGFQCK